MTIEDLLDLRTHNELLQVEAKDDVLQALQCAWIYLNRAVQIFEDL